MIGRVPRWIRLVGIVIAASSCDNVSWGGFEMGLRGPAADSATLPPDSLHQISASTLSPSSDLSLGPVLYAGVREGGRARIVPVAEITAEGLRPLPSGTEAGEVETVLLNSRLRPGAALTLFHQGVRIGTLEVEESAAEPASWCGATVAATGILQLTQEAAGAQRFLALDQEIGRRYTFDPFVERSSVYDQRVASLNLGAEAVPLVGARWPESLLEIRQDIQVFQLTGASAPAVMATFLFRDQLRVGPAPAGAYSLLVLGEPRGDQFDLTYAWYRPADLEGKGAPRFFSRLDWDGDGDEEILLEVLGTETRWFAALNRGPDAWILTYQDSCGDPRGTGG